MSNSYTDSEPEEFDATLWMALADTWWDLGRRLAPFVGDTLPEEEKEGKLRSWVTEIHAGTDDDEVIAAVTTDALRTFVRNALELLEQKYRGQTIAARVQSLITDARYDVADDGRRLKFGENSAAFWAWECVFLFQELTYDDPGWETAVGFCDGCSAFFLKTRKDQRYHADVCRKKAANKRFYKTRGKLKRRRIRRAIPKMSQSGTLGTDPA